MRIFALCSGLGAIVLATLALASAPAAREAPGRPLAPDEMRRAVGACQARRNAALCSMRCAASTPPPSVGHHPMTAPAASTHPAPIPPPASTTALRRSHASSAASMAERMALAIPPPCKGIVGKSTVAQTFPSSASTAPAAFLASSVVRRCAVSSVKATKAAAQPKKSN